MGRLFLIIPVLLLIVSAGCSDSGAKTLFETAQLEERQHNIVHAKELYREILDHYPESDYARKAKERLVTLETESSQTLSSSMRNERRLP